MNSLLKSIGILVSLGLMAALVANKLGGLFPEMDGIAWVIILAGFGIWVFFAMKSEAWLEKLWPGRFSEDQRIWLVIVVILGLGGLAMYLGWDILGQYLPVHFGPVVR